MKKQIINIPKTSVEFEDGRVELVPEFRISRTPVTIGEFRSIAQSHNYLTTRELRKDSAETYLQNEAVSDTAIDDIANLPARYLSFEDAEFFCKCVGVRLPSEAEWLAAAIVDDRVYDRDEWKMALQKAAKSPNSLEWLSSEYTSTVTNPNQIVVRRGPKLVRSSNWRERVHAHRYHASRNGGDAIIQFRVCVS